MHPCTKREVVLEVADSAPLAENGRLVLSRCWTNHGASVHDFPVTLDAHMALRGAGQVSPSAGGRPLGITSGFMDGGAYYALFYQWSWSVHTAPKK